MTTLWEQKKLDAIDKLTAKASEAMAKLPYPANLIALPALFVQCRDIASQSQFYDAAQGNRTASIAVDPVVSVDVKPIVLRRSIEGVLEGASLK